MEEAIKEENKKLRHLRLMVDLTIQLLYQEEDLSLIQGLNRIRAAKEYALMLFPDKGDVFDLIYRPRFLRVLQERGLLIPSSN